MKVKLWTDPGNFGASYSEALLKKLCKTNNMDIVKNNPEMHLVSMCDPADLPLLKAARTESKGEPVIMGGFEAFFGEPYLAWADGVSVGEGFEFFEHVGAGKDWRELKSVLTKNKDKVFPSYRVDWNKCPVVRTGKKKAYYLAGRGCHNKCKFCATSWVQPNKQQSYSRLKRVGEMVAKKKCKATFICNDSREIPRMKSVNAASVTVKDYLKNPVRYKSSMLHFGIEGWSEKERRGFSKPIKDADLIKLINATKRHKQRCELFFIVGRPGFSLDAVRKMADMLPTDTDHLPPIFVKVTYFDPCPHTPLAKTSPATEYVDIEKTFRIFNSRNKRFRVFPCRSLARSNWRTVLHRCSPEQAIRLGKEPSDTNKAGSRTRWMETLDKDLQKLGGGIDFEPCSKIKTRYKE